ncbi:hypothetical protein F0P96_18655 [Hymenobacter busanensis]|uniref:Uncharacterized protein n=1 Tax=Hymenobacter busanensis TaxID=2607656 RepID=A0A7L4ZS94_9BACT|nr:hypothetical protein [Hymenobacter busanensis]KAA9327253.1 hypothetical protein F0P96_18655 [Hymenobacter busanensis]QHJ05918.1 hypothetical protein GUY19_00860 [Hymenobacter busanensis]
MTEENKRKWEVSISIVGTVLTIASIFIGISQFNRQQNDNQVLEFKREMLKKRADTYGKICESAGILASEYTTDTSFKKSMEDFERYYWGSLNIPPDRSVTTAVEEFRETLKHVDRRSIDGHNSLAYDAANLQDSCYRALSRSWQSLNN